MSPEPRYDEPFAWWGPGWQAPAPRDIAQLLREGTIDSWTAANLWAALVRRRSLTVIAGASGVGKTTLLTALLEFLPPNTRRIYARGCFESFAFMSDPSVSPAHSALLINEISPHLPVYLWGQAVGRVLEATRRGFTLLATAHADSVHELVGALTGSPLHIAAAETAAFEFVVVLERDELNPDRRRIGGLWSLLPTRDGVTISQLGSHTPQNYISQETSTQEPNPEAWFPPEELARRQCILEDLREWRIARLPVANMLIDTGTRAEALSHRPAGE